MAEGQFNLLDFINRIGLKNIRSMPVVENIQPVAVVGQHSELTPNFAAPSGFAGSSEPAVIGEFSRWEVVSRGLGGMVVDGINFIGLSNMRLFIAVGILPAGDDLPTSVTSNVAPVSVVRASTSGASAPPDSALIAPGVYYPPPQDGIYIPVGQSLNIVADTANIGNSSIIFFRDVPASEHAPS